MPNLRFRDITPLVAKAVGCDSPRVRIVRCPSCNRVIFKSVRGQASVEVRCRDCKANTRFHFDQDGVSYEVLEKKSGKGGEG